MVLNFTYLHVHILFVVLKLLETIIISTVVVKELIKLTYKLCKCVWPCLCVVNLPYYVCMVYWNYILKNSLYLIGIYSSSKRVNM